MSFSAEAQEVLGARESVPVDEWARAKAEEPGAALTVTGYFTPSVCREQSRQGRIGFCWSKGHWVEGLEQSWVSLHIIQEDPRKFEDGDQETQEMLQAVQDEKEVDQLNKIKGPLEKSLAFLRQRKENTIVELCATREVSQR